MNKLLKHTKLFTIGFAAISITTFQVVFAAPPTNVFKWSTVVNNNDQIPGAPAERTFNSYNQPSVNENGLVVMRARSRGGDGQGQATHGIYSRDMSKSNNPVVKILDRSTLVPEPNNLDETFGETPSFPRIDMKSDTIATRGNHRPVWEYLLEGSETRAGTTGIYTNPFGPLITGAAKLGNVPDFSFFEVPDEPPGTPFEVFPGAPSVTDGDTIVFKGNYTVGVTSKTGVYYRKLKDEPIILPDYTELYPAGGTSTAPVIPIANTDTLIPSTTTEFGSTAPPSAAQGKVVFAGFDNEENPTLGGIYLAPLEPHPELNPLVRINGEVPGEFPSETFTNLGEGVAFDGRYAGFWGAWGEVTKTVRLYCPEEGNRDRRDYCNQNLQCEGGTTELDVNSICNDVDDPKYDPDPEKRICYQEKQVPVNQGIFVHDTKRGKTYTVAKTDEDFDELLLWNYSGKTPCVGSGHSEEESEDDGEAVRWRSSAFVAVSGRGSSVWTAFKARRGELDSNNAYSDPVDGIYLDKKPGNSSLLTIADTTMPGTYLDSEAPADSRITELGIEREGLRGRWLVINASMGEEGGEEEDGIAGIYMTRIP